MIVVGLSHRSAPIEVRERLAISDRALPETLCTLSGLREIGEVVVLSTCNRVEIYAAANRTVDERALESAVIHHLAELGGREVVPHLVSRRGSDAVRHLFRVASSLDSLVVGEPQILGQLKEAIHTASEARTVGRELGAAMKRALSIAKRVRSETQIGAGQVSIPSVAVDLARQIFESLAGQCTLMVGAGEMAETAARLMARAGAHVLVVNRSAARAEALAATVGGKPLAWEHLDDSLVSADIVISSTASPGYVITHAQLHDLRRKRRGRSLFLIDIAVPRDIEPRVNQLDNVYLYDIDDLSQVVASSLADRHAEAERAEAIIDQEMQSYEGQRAQQAVTPVIVALRERTRSLLLAELERSYKGRLKHLQDEDKKALGVMVEAAVNKLMHAPTRHLKQLAQLEQADDVAQLVQRLFELAPKGPDPDGPDPDRADPDRTARDEARQDDEDREDGPGPEARVMAR